MKINLINKRIIKLLLLFFITSISYAQQGSITIKQNGNGSGVVIQQNGHYKIYNYNNSSDVTKLDSILKANSSLFKSNNISIGIIKKYLNQNYISISQLDNKIKQVLKKLNAISDEKIIIIPMNNTKPNPNVNIIIGGNYCTIERARLINGQSGGILKNKCFNLAGGVEPLIIRIKNGYLYISLKIFDLDNKIVGEIVDNVFTSNKNNIFKYPHNASSLEVIDQYDVPVLQIKYIDINNIWIGGAISNDGGVIFAYEDGVTSMRKDPEAVKYFNEKLKKTVKDIYLERARKIKRILID